MRKPFQTGAKPSEQPNEPKMYPGQLKAGKDPGGDNMEGFAEKAPIKAPDQLEHLSVAIDPVHIFGQHSNEKKQVHVSPKMANANKMPSFADQEKVKVPRVKAGLKGTKI